MLGRLLGNEHIPEGLPHCLDKGGPRAWLSGVTRNIHVRREIFDLSECSQHIHARSACDGKYSGCTTNITYFPIAQAYWMHHSIII